MGDSQRLQEAKTAMLVHVPFFSSLLYDMMDLKEGKFPHIFGDRPGTAATDGKTIYIDTDFFNSLKLPEAVFLLCHEIGHCMWMHMARAKMYSDIGFDGEPFDARKWNRAGDYVINDMLVKSGIGTMPKMGLLDAKYTNDMLVDDVYRQLDDDEGGDGGGEGDGTLDKHIHAPSNVTEAEVKRAIQTAVEAAKATGKLPSALERFAGRLLQPKVNWKEKLRTHLTRALGREATTWNRPHRRRLVTQGVYMPTRTGFGCGEVVVVIDTSGSIGEKEITVFLSELSDILTSCQPERVWLLACDADIHDIHCLAPDQNIVDHPPKITGGRGTSFIPPFEWVDKEGVRPEALVYFTDMYGPAPDTAPAYPVIWCKTTQQKAPWGEEIEVDIDGST